MGFELVCDSVVINKILYSHKPQRFDQPIQANIHGHFHSTPVANWEPELKAVLTPNHYLLISEDYDLKPILLDDFLKEKGILSKEGK